MFRYWDGTQWSPTLSPNPYVPPPGVGNPPIAQFSPSPTQPVPARRGSRVGLWVLTGVLVVALMVGAVNLLSGGRINPFNPESTPSNVADDFCPQPDLESTPEPVVHPPGRVQGGKISYPKLESPWEEPTWDPRMPFGRGVSTQVVMVEPNYSSLNSWVASILVGELVAGDGFFSPEQGSEIVGRCVLGQFYGPDSEVKAETIVNKATKVDGHDAWLLEMHLTFDIKGLNEKGETAIILIVATGGESSSVFYASIPDSRPELLQEAREVQSKLRVEP